MAIVEPTKGYSYRPPYAGMKRNLARGRALNFAEAEYGAPRPSRVQGRTSVAPNYADIDAASFGALASGNAPSITTNENTITSPSIIENRVFGDPRRMMNAAIQNSLMKTSLGLQRSDLLADTAMTLDDIKRAASRGRRGVVDTLNARNVWNSGIKDRGLGEHVGDELRYLGRTRNKALRGLRDINLAGVTNDFTLWNERSDAMSDDADQIRANIANRIKEISV